MPKRVDYAARWEFLRQAAFELVRDESVEALTRRALAAELGCGLNTVLRLIDSRVDLVRLAAREVTTRRRRGRLARRSDDPQEFATNLVRALMPEDDSHLDEELVWIRLIAACSLRPSGSVPRGSARKEFWIAQRGYDDGLPVEAPAKETRNDREDRHTALQSYLDEREAQLKGTIDQILDVLAIPHPRDDCVTTLIALFEGLTLSACLGRLSPAQATDLAIAHVLAIGSSRGQPVSEPGPAAGDCLRTSPGEHDPGE